MTFFISNSSCSLLVYKKATAFFLYLPFYLFLPISCPPRPPQPPWQPPFCPLVLSVWPSFGSHTHVLSCSVCLSLSGSSHSGLPPAPACWSGFLLLFTGEHCCRHSGTARHRCPPTEKRQSPADCSSRLEGGREESGGGRGSGPGRPGHRR